MSQVEEANAVLDRVRAVLSPGCSGPTKGAKNGKADSPAFSASLQDLFMVLTTCMDFADVVLSGLRMLEDALGFASASTVLRLEGGLKVLPRLLRVHGTDAAILSACGRVLSRAITSSTANQQALAKEKGLPGMLLSGLAANSRDAVVVAPLLEVVVGLSRVAKGAQALASDTMVLLARELLVNFMGEWDVFGLVLKALKLQAKQEGCGMMLMRAAEGEVSRMLLAVARLLARLPGQHRLLKRVSRTLWLLHQCLLPPLPPLEPLVLLPPKDAPHLALASATDCMESQRLMELVPEEFAAELTAELAPGSSSGSQRTTPSLSAPGGAAVDARVLLSAARTAHCVRAPAQLQLLPPTAAQMTAAASAMPANEPLQASGPTVAVDMMMHDLRRIVAPDSLIGRQVFISTRGSRDDPSMDCGDDVAPAGNGALSALQLRDPGYAVAAAARTAERSGADYGELLTAAAVNQGQQLGPATTWLQAPNQAPRASSSRRGHRSSSQQSTLPPLSFQSSFESGNLRAAIQVHENEYDLFIAPDLNDRSEGGNLCQWFYFSVDGMHPGVPYKFNLVNLLKKQSLFGSGKQPLVCRALRRSSEQGLAQPQPLLEASAINGGGSHQEANPAVVTSAADGQWVRAGAQVAYFPSPYRGRPTAPPAVDVQARITRAPPKKTAGPGRPKLPGKPAAGGLVVTPPVGSSPANTKDVGQTAGRDAVPAMPGSVVGPGLYCVTFTLVVQKPGTYYIASCYPYTYTDLQDHLDGVAARLGPGTTSQGPGDRCGDAAFAPCPSAQASLDTGSPDLTDSAPLSRPGSGSEPGERGLSASTKRALSDAASCQLHGGILVRSLLGYTLAGHALELLTITDFSAPPEMVAARECVAINARIHPGETCASWIMQGLVDFLTSSDPAACLLRSSFVFKMVPMLNPDGVVNGSYRCSLAGCDLNRMWEKPQRSIQPTIFHSKRLLQALASGGGGRLALFIDIHGHSCKEDAFFYGCEPNLANYPPGPSSPVKVSQTGVPPGLTAQPPQAAAPQAPSVPRITGDSDSGSSTSGVGPVPSAAPVLAAGSGTSISARAAARLRVRMLPYLLSKASSKWSLPKCSWRIRKAKLGAARVVVNREIGCAGAYTLEASLGGQSTGRLHFTLADYLALGTELGRGIAELAEVDDTTLLDEMAAAVTMPPYSGTYTV